MSPGALTKVTGKGSGCEDHSWHGGRGGLRCPLGCLQQKSGKVKGPGDRAWGSGTGSWFVEPLMRLPGGAETIPAAVPSLFLPCSSHAVSPQARLLGPAPLPSHLVPFLACCWGIVWEAGDLLPYWVVSSLSPVCRPQAQESNYENLSQMNPRGPPAATCSP